MRSVCADDHAAGRGQLLAPDPHQRNERAGAYRCAAGLPRGARGLSEHRPALARLAWNRRPAGAPLRRRDGTTAETWAKERRAELKVNSTITAVSDPTAGALEVREGRADALLGERTILLNLAAQHRDKLSVVDRLFEIQPLALALARGDEDFRLAVDRSLSRLYRSGEIYPLYERYLGKADDKVREAFRIIALPE
jgi:polar amino acid transport system substrate-binding protein